MDSTTEKIPTNEVVIGTDNAAPLNSEDAMVENELLKDSAPHQLADVELHLRKLRAAVDPSIPAMKVDVEEVTELATQVEMWASAESHFPDHPSVLAECEALDVLFPMLKHERSPVCMAALMCMQKIFILKLQRRIAKNYRLATTMKMKKNPTEPNDKEMVEKAVELTPYQLLFLCMRKFPNKEELQVLAIATAVQLAHMDVEEFLVADVISAALAAMKAHRKNNNIQRHGCALFASLVDCPRADPKDVPIPVLFVNVGAVVEFLFAAFKAHPTNTDIACSVAHCTAVMSAFRANKDELIATDIINVCVKIIEICKYIPDALQEAITTLSNMTSEMDTLQKKSIVHVVRNLMTKVAETKILACCCALCLVIIRSFAPKPPVAPQPKPGESGSKFTVSKASSSAKHVDATAESSITASSSKDDKEEGSQQEEPQQQQQRAPLPPPEEFERFEQECEDELQMKRFMSANIVSFISLAMEHYGDLDPVLQDIGEKTLRSLVISKWR